MNSTYALPATPRFGAGFLKGRMRGALICGFFGAAWMYEALYFGNIATPVWLAAITILTLTLVVWPVVRLRVYRPLAYSAADRAFWASIAKPYWINFAIEWALCFIAAIWLSHHQRYDLIPHFLGVIIGLHFLPLGKLFKLPLYYLTGIVMVVGVLATLAIPAGYARNIAACGIDGLALWTTAVVLLGQDWLSSNEL
jgi:hypothetical protein